MLLDNMHKQLMVQYQQALNGKMHIDALKWMAKTLAQLSPAKYQAVLKGVSENTKNDTLRYYAYKVVDKYY